MHKIIAKIYDKYPGNSQKCTIVIGAKLDDAIELARVNRDPMGMILAAADLNKMMGFYK